MLSEDILKQLAGIVGPDHVLSSLGELLVYECDGFTIERAVPRAVVLPGSTEEVSQVMALLSKHDIPIVPRGAGTCLSGGATPKNGAVILELSRMNRILEVDYRNRQALVESGLVNLRLSQQMEADGYYFAPDPSSQKACTIGGNIAENAGGPHCLKYGVTDNHILGIEVVLSDGTVTWLGGPSEDTPGYDLKGLLIGSEGTMAITTKALVKLSKSPQTLRTLLVVFNTVDDASQCVSDIIAAGIIPAAMEMMDKQIVTAVEDAFNVGLPRDAEAVVIIELDDLEAGIDQLAERVRDLAEKNRARDIQLAADPEHRAQLWKSRKHAIGALGRLSSSYVLQDGVVPRRQLPETLRRIHAVSKKYDLPIPNLMHAGDGNVHPIILFDERDPDQLRRCLQASHDILAACVELGGTVTGEHGVGLEKMDFVPMLFSEADLEPMKAARDVFNPRGLLNSGKIFPIES